MLPALALGAVAALLTAISQVLMAITSRRVGSTITSCLVLVASLLWFLPLAVGMRFPDDPTWWQKVAFIGVVNAVAFILAVEALRLGPLAVVGPLAASSSVVTVVLAAVLLGETLPPIAFIAVPMVGAGAVLCSTTPAPGRFERRVEPGAVLMASSVLLVGLFTIELQEPVREAGWASTVIVARVVSVAAVLGLLVAQAFRRRLHAGVPRVPATSGRADTGSARSIGSIVLIGLLISTSQILVAAGVGTGPAWLVGATMALSPAIVTGAGIVMLGERPRQTQVLGIVAIGIGVTTLISQVAGSG